VDKIPIEVLNKMKTHYGQVGHYQKLYEDAKAGNLEVPQQQTQQQPPQEQQPDTEPLTPETFQKAYAPVVKAARDEGWVGEFLAEEDPVFVSVVANNVSNVQRLTAAFSESVKQNQLLQQRLAQIEGRFQEEEIDTVSQKIGTVLDKISDESEFYAPLKDRKTREKLFESWGEMFKGVPNAEEMESVFIQNLLAGDLEAGLRKLSAGFLSTAADGTFKKASEEVRKVAKKRRSRTAGERTSSPAAAPQRKAPSTNGLDDFAPEG
jgi:hypothetical protein